MSTTGSLTSFREAHDLHGQSAPTLARVHQACPGELDGMRCEKLSGHAGLHCAGNTSWGALTSSQSPEAHDAYRAASREFIALRGTRLYPGVDRELPPFEFDASFPPIAGLGWDAGWERVPDSLVGPVQLVLCGMRLRWVRVRPAPPRPHPQYEFVQARSRYGTAIDAGMLVEIVDKDPMRFRTF